MNRFEHLQGRLTKLIFHNRLFLKDKQILLAKVQKKYRLELDNFRIQQIDF